MVVIEDAEEDEDGRRFLWELYYSFYFYQSHYQFGCFLNYFKSLDLYPSHGTYNNVLALEIAHGYNINKQMNLKRR